MPDWFVLAGIACLIVAVFVVVLVWIFDLLHTVNEDEQYWRHDYQRQIRCVIENMIDATSDHYEDLEWRLHSLLYEYRH